MKNPECTCNEYGINMGIDNPYCPVHGEEIMNPRRKNDIDKKKYMGKEYGSGRHARKTFDPRDEEKTQEIDLEDFLDEPDEDDFEIALEEILKKLD